MKNKTDVLVQKLNDLYRLYEEYCWHNSKLEIVIIFEGKTIQMYLNDKSGNIDTFCLSFSKYERKIYQYISLKLFNLLLGDVYIYMDGNVFYNESHKPYLRVVVCDNEVLFPINKLVFNQENTYIGKGVNDFCKREPFNVYSDKFIKKIDERIYLSKRKLRSENR